MEEHGHQHAHPPHRTGHSWLDISLALSAFFVSLISLWLAMHNARTMEKLVASNSLQKFSTSPSRCFSTKKFGGPEEAVFAFLDTPYSLRLVQAFARMPDRPIQRLPPPWARPRCPR